MCRESDLVSNLVLYAFKNLLKGENGSVKDLREKYFDQNTCNWMQKQKDLIITESIGILSPPIINPND